jgi:hypothetical protein
MNSMGRMLAARAHPGRDDAAKSALDELLRVQPDCSVSLLTDRAPMSPDRLEMFADGLRKAGLTE